MIMKHELQLEQSQELYKHISTSTLGVKNNIGVSSTANVSVSNIIGNGNIRIQNNTSNGNTADVSFKNIFSNNKISIGVSNSANINIQNSTSAMATSTSSQSNRICVFPTQLAGWLLAGNAEINNKIKNCIAGVNNDNDDDDTDVDEDRNDQKSLFKTFKIGQTKPKL